MGIFIPISNIPPSIKILYISIFFHNSLRLAKDTTPSGNTKVRLIGEN